MQGHETTIAGPDGSFMAYQAGSGPAIIVIQEIFGVNAVMRGICDDLAQKGFTAICPDLFWRIEPRIQLTDQTEDEWKQAFDLFGKFDADAGVLDIAATIASARRAGAEKVGAVGYCLGGFLAYLTACRTDADASVGYYGVNIQTRLDEAAELTHPLMLHIAGQDEYVPAEAQNQIREALRDHPQITLHHYPERDHAFARIGGAHYHATDAANANARTLDFFKIHLS
ncbi:MAG: dienelactone hydrolase family protein [Pseudomonadota bacterium]